MTGISLKKTLLGSKVGGACTAVLLSALLIPSTAHAAGVLDSVSSWVVNAVAGTAGYFVGAFVAPLALVLLSIANLILWVSGLVFNWAVIRTVYQFGTYFGTSDAMLTAWGIMRDVANIGLLFGFILMGVLLILNVEGGGHGHGGGISAKKAIPRLIIFAVLLNFSLFTTQAVIDVSNGLASVFAEQAGQKCAGGVSDACVNVGISGLISDRAGVFSIWSNGPSYVTDPLKAAIVYLMLAVFVLITATVLIAASVMFVYRAVVLSFLMVTSPIGFAGMAIPGLKKIGNEWWSKLISQAFFAPVYLLLIFVSLKLTETLSSASSGQSLASALAGTGGEAGGAGAGNIQVVLVFAVVIGFMIASLISANKLGAMGAKFATNSASGLVFGAATRGTNLVTGGAAYAARRRIQSSRLGDTMAGKALVNRVLRPIEKSNMDLRRAGVGALLGAAGATTGAKPAEHATFGDTKHLYQDARDGKGRKALDREYDAERALQSLEDNAHDGNMTPDDDKTLASLSTKELEELHGIKEGVAQLAQKLTPEQFENLMKSDKLEDSQKNALRDGRFSALGEEVERVTRGKAPNATAADVQEGNAAAARIRKWSSKDLEQLGKSPAFAALLQDPDFAAEINDDQYDAVMKTGKATAAQQALLENARDERFNPARAAATIANMNTEQISKLKGSILERPHVYQNLTLGDFEKIRDKGSLNANQRNMIGAHIASISNNAQHPQHAAYTAYINSDPRVKTYWNIP